MPHAPRKNCKEFRFHTISDPSFKKDSRSSSPLLMPLFWDDVGNQDRPKGDLLENVSLAEEERRVRAIEESKPHKPAYEELTGATMKKLPGSENRRKLPAMAARRKKIKVKEEPPSPTTEKTPPPPPSKSSLTKAERDAEIAAAVAGVHSSSIFLWGAPVLNLLALLYPDPERVTDIHLQHRCRISCLELMLSPSGTTAGMNTTPGPTSTHLLTPTAQLHTHPLTLALSTASNQDLRRDGECGADEGDAATMNNETTNNDGRSSTMSGNSAFKTLMFTPCHFNYICVSIYLPWLWPQATQNQVVLQQVLFQLGETCISSTLKLAFSASGTTLSETPSPYFTVISFTSMDHNLNGVLPDGATADSVLFKGREAVSSWFCSLEFRYVRQ
ncbi:hypothetical protein Pelo_3409 [Pelomyxa schiedti]|nr:hypothetical protein Pelo_3409 [Pelomyxa schiedti]